MTNPVLSTVTMTRLEAALLALDNAEKAIVTAREHFAEETAEGVMSAAIEVRSAIGRLESVLDELVYNPFTDVSIRPGLNTGA